MANDKEKKSGGLEDKEGFKVGDFVQTNPDKSAAFLSPKKVVEVFEDGRINVGGMIGTHEDFIHVLEEEEVGGFKITDRVTIGESGKGGWIVGFVDQEHAVVDSIQTNIRGIYPLSALFSADKKENITKGEAGHISAPASQTLSPETSAEVWANKHINEILGPEFKFGQEVKVGRSDGTIEFDWTLTNAAADKIFLTRGNKDKLEHRFVSIKDFLELNSPKIAQEALENTQVDSLEVKPPSPQIDKLKEEPLVKKISDNNERFSRHTSDKQWQVRNERIERHLGSGFKSGDKFASKIEGDFVEGVLEDATAYNAIVKNLADGRLVNVDKKEFVKEWKTEEALSPTERILLNLREPYRQGMEIRVISGTGEEEIGYKLQDVKAINGVRYVVATRKGGRTSGGEENIHVPIYEFLEWNEIEIDVVDEAEKIDAEIAEGVLKAEFEDIDFESLNKKSPEEAEKVEQNWAAKLWGAGVLGVKNQGSKVYKFVKEEAADLKRGFFGKKRDKAAQEALGETERIERELKPEEKFSLLRGLATVGYKVQEWKGRSMSAALEYVGGKQKDEAEMKRLSFLRDASIKNYKATAARAQKQQEELFASGGLISGATKKTVGVGTFAGNALLYYRVFADTFGGFVGKGLNYLSPLRNFTAGAMLLGRSAAISKEAELNMLAMESRIKDIEEAQVAALELYEKAKAESKDGKVSREDLEKNYVKELPEEILKKMQALSANAGVFRYVPQVVAAWGIKKSLESSVKQLKSIEEFQSDTYTDEFRKNDINSLLLNQAKFLKEMELMVGEGGAISLWAYASRVLEMAGKTTATALAIETLANGMIRTGEALDSFFGGQALKKSGASPKTIDVVGSAGVHGTVSGLDRPRGVDTIGIVDKPEVENAYIDTTPVAKPVTNPVFSIKPEEVEDTEKQFTRKETEEFTRKYKEGQLKTGLPADSVAATSTKGWEMPKSAPTETPVAPKADLTKTIFDTKNKELAEEFYRREQANKFELADKEEIKVPFKKVGPVVAQSEAVASEARAEAQSRGEKMVDVSAKDPQFYAEKVLVPEKENVFADEPATSKTESAPEPKEVPLSERPPQVRRFPETEERRYPSPASTRISEKFSPDFSDAKLGQIVEDEVKADIKNIYHIRFYDRWGANDWKEARVIPAKQFLETFSGSQNAPTRNVLFEGSKDKHAKLFRHLSALMETTGITPRNDEKVEDFLKRLTLEEIKRINSPISSVEPAQSIVDASEFDRQAAKAGGMDMSTVLPESEEYLPAQTRGLKDIDGSGVRMSDQVAPQGFKEPEGMTEPNQKIEEFVMPVEEVVAESNANGKSETASSPEIENTADSNVEASDEAKILAENVEDPSISKVEERQEVQPTEEKDGPYDMSTSEEQQLLEQVRREIAAISVPKEPTAEDFAYDLNQKVVNSEAVEEAVGLGLEKELDALSTGAVKTELDEIYGQKRFFGLFGRVSGENSKFWQNVRVENIKRFEDFYKRFGKEGAGLSPYNNKENEKQYKLFQFIQRLRVESGTEPLLTETVDSYVHRAMKEALAKAHHLKR